MSESNREEPITFKLCSRISTCCPEVEIRENRVTIEDDDGGRVRLSREEFRFLLEQSGEYLE